MCLDEEETNDMVVVRGSLQSNRKSGEENGRVVSGGWAEGTGGEDGMGLTIEHKYPQLV